MTTINTAVLFPDVSMSEVMHKFRASKGTIILRAYSPKAARPKKPKFEPGQPRVKLEKEVNLQHWNIDFIGPRPELTGLAHEG